MEHRWDQPFRWGLLMAFDDQGRWELPEGLGDNDIRASPTCLAVPVLHSQDVVTPDDLGPDEPIREAHVSVTVLVDVTPDTGAEFDGELDCQSGRLNVGDAEVDRIIEVRPGRLRVQVQREPAEFAESVTLRICAS